MNLKELVQFKEKMYTLRRKTPEGTVYYVDRKGIGHQFSSDPKEAAEFKTFFSADCMKTELERSLNAKIEILCT